MNGEAGNEKESDWPACSGLAFIDQRHGTITISSSDATMFWHGPKPSGQKDWVELTTQSSSVQNWSSGSPPSSIYKSDCIPCPKKALDSHSSTSVLKTKLGNTVVMSLKWDGITLRPCLIPGKFERK